MPEVVIQYDLDDTGKMVNLRRKEEVTRCKECWNVHVDTIFGGYWCNRMARMCLYQSVDTVMLGILFQLMKKSNTTGIFLVGIIYRTMLTHGCHYQNRMQKGEPMAKIHDLFIVELAEVIKGYGNNPDDSDPFRLSEFYRFYELPNIAVSRENFEKMRPVTPQRKKGKWITDKYGNVLCSECNWCAPQTMTGCLANRHLDYEKSAFCWHCGADMREDAEEPKKCDNCLHEKEPWSMQCHQCEDFNLWEAKE